MAVYYSYISTDKNTEEPNGKVTYLLIYSW